jgi:peptidoglycan/xylan/chitin deacetylase (PgdA/CDA1 family)
MRSFWLWVLVGCAGDPTGDDDPADDPTDTDTGAAPTDPTTPPVRRHDCSGMDPADAPPLGGRVALTFDDGPDLDATPLVLDTLRAYAAPATFFMLGERLSDPAIWPLVDEMVADPLFDLANHTWDHADLSHLSLSDVEDEIDDTTALLETWVTPTFFRFPYGSSTCETHDLATDRGLRVAGWHIDTGDWCYAAVGEEGVCLTEDYWRVPEIYEADMIGWTMEQIRRHDGGIVLLHDIHLWTAATLEDLILAIEAEGFTFVALDDASAWPNLVAGTPVDLPYLGEPCDVVDDLCWVVEDLAWCEPVAPDDPTSTAGVCTMPCEGYCLDRDGAALTLCAETLPDAGQCIGRSQPINEFCALVPGTTPRVFDRFVGESGAASTADEVCAPPHW